MNNDYKVDFLIEGKPASVTITAKDKSKVIEKMWAEYGNTVYIKAIEGVDNGK